ncbi:hypothetical protein [Comamonas sp. JC664]|uniref:hypothetical protein n=1 Tax=Comamonas sp. JC664 TaxID=2801917 RepID=UPI00174BE660|nr:hypothetical protein [Comamonas sp. JC664]MBL0693993.1 hypothetical protein [Comamonas sp. JC664]GHH04112.1 hypothetical protein GCM10012319_73390 [Comamonas sp. KCTC 72670]
MSDEKVRYGRSQKFQLSAKGTEAVASYSAVIEAAKAGTGRAQFDAARATWGASLGLSAEDGLYLVEFEAGGRTISEAARNLEACDTTAKAVKDAVERLLKCGMLEPLPAPPPPPAAPPRRYW